MNKKIFSLPTIILSLVLAAIGHYWGTAFQQAKVVDVRLDQAKQGANSASKPVPVANAVPASSAATTSAPLAPPANQNARPNTAITSVNRITKKIVKPAPVPIATQPAKTSPVAVPATQPIPAPSVQAPVQQPAPVPTTKVS